MNSYQLLSHEALIENIHKSKKYTEWPNRGDR